jgi:hypothetical protein
MFQSILHALSGRNSIMITSKFLASVRVKGQVRALIASWLILLDASGTVSAHGFAGKRFFPTTFAAEDPFVSDEFSLLGSHIREPGADDEPSVHATEIAAEYSKRITPKFGISLEGEYRSLHPNGESTENGFGNLEVAARYQFLTSVAHETIMSVGLAAEVGGTGDEDVEAEPFSVISPTLLFGKGFGDLPEALKFLRPTAVTSAFAVNFPTDSETVTQAVQPETGDIETDIERNSTTLSWGLTAQYNLDYLQSFVQDVGLGAPFSHLIPVVEANFETCLDRGCGGETSGTVNPGLIWFGGNVQLGIAAQIPVDNRTGNDIGVLALVHFFIDDLFPNSLGRPIFVESM